MNYLIQWFRLSSFRRGSFIAGVIFFIATSFIQGQVPAPATMRPVEVTLADMQVKGKLPFDAPFVLLVTPLANTTQLKLLSVKEITGTTMGANLLVGTVNHPRSNTEAKVLPLQFIAPDNKYYLRPNRLYNIEIEATYEREETETNTGTGTKTKTKSETVTVTKTEAKTGNRTKTETETETITDTKTETKTYNLIGYTDAGLSDNIKVDFGVGYAPKPNAVFGLSSVHFYLTPINEDTDLVVHKLAPKRQFLVRTSLFVGLSPLTLSEDTEQPIKTRYKLGNLVYGVGIRSPFYGTWMKWKRVSNTNADFGRIFLQPMRLNIGVLNFTQAHENPAINKDVNKQALYVSLTYDLNIATILGPIGKLLQ